MKENFFLPDGWVYKKINDVVMSCSNGISMQQNTNSKGLMVTRIETISDGKIDLNKVGWIDKKGDMSKYKLEIGDILYSNINSVKHIGKVAYVGDDYDLYHGMNLLNLKPKREVVYPLFLFYLLSSTNMKKYFEAICKPAINQASINQSELKNTYINLPPYVEQRTISDILSTVDYTIEKTEALIEKYQKMKEGMMQDLFTRGIDEDGKLRPPYNEAPELYKETELGMVPKEWEVKIFKSLLNEGIIASIQDGNHGESHPKANDFMDSGVSFLIANNLKGNTIDITSGLFITYDKYRSLRIGFCNRDDVLLTHKGTVGLTALVKDLPNEIVLSPQVTAYRISDMQRINNSFLYYYFQTSIFQRTIKNLSKQSTRDYIGITSQQKLNCFVPTIDEQKMIVKKLTSASSFISKEKKRLKKMQKLKQALMQDLLTGKVRVPA